MRLAVLLSLLAAGAGCAPAPPDKARMEAMAGADLDDPVRFPRGVVASLKDVYSSPIPNQMVAVEDGAHVWMYGFAADSAFRPPPSSPLRCTTERVYGEPELTCGTEDVDERGRWSYSLWFRPGQRAGGFSAYLHSAP